jgi:hypothetical protein
MVLESGHDVEKERADNAAKLKALCDHVVKHPDFDSKNIDDDPELETFCNLAVAHVSKGMGIQGLAGILANEIMRRLNAGEIVARQEKDTERVARHAMRGGFAIAGMTGKPGHVATIYPAACEKSPSLGIPVPICAHVGQKGSNGVKRVSSAFPVSRIANCELQYWLFGEV